MARIEKPIVASMSDVAASAGTTSAWGRQDLRRARHVDRLDRRDRRQFVLSGLMDKLGVTTDTVTSARMARSTDQSTLLRESSAAMKRLMDDTYHQFVSKAAEGREDFRRASRSSPEAASTPAGRPRSSAWLTSSAPSRTPSPRPSNWRPPRGRTPELLILPKAQGFLEALVGPLEDRDVSIRVDALGLGGFAQKAHTGGMAKLDSLSRLLSKEPVVLVMPYQLNIR